MIDPHFAVAPENLITFARFGVHVWPVGHQPAAVG
jgi:hypothetical protein